MKITVEIKENALLKAADEMIKSADELSKKAWALKGMILGEDSSPSARDGELSLNMDKVGDQLSQMDVNLR